MENDWDLELSHQIDSHLNQIEEKEFEPDFMLQPITTQENFNLKQKNNESPSPIKRQPFQSKKQPESTEQQLTHPKSKKENKGLEQQAKKFRQYLNQKVQQLRKSKQRIDLSESPSPQPKSKQKTNPLRKIINHQQQKHKQNQKLKLKSSEEKPKPEMNLKQPSNFVNKNSSQTKNGAHPGTTSNSVYKNPNIKRQEHEKKFSNSHSNLVKNVEKKEFVSQNKINTVADIKKSLNLQSNTKSPRLPNLAQKTKIPFPQKKEPQPIHERRDSKKSTIEPVHAKQTKQQQRKRTPQSKNSFRIKRTSNVIQPHSNQADLDGNKFNQTSLKSIKNQRESPVHQGKNKRMREEFMRMNEEERKLQVDILKHHQSTKQTLDSMMAKYNLSRQAFSKYGVKKETQFPNQPEKAEKQQQMTKLTKQSRLTKPSQKQILQKNSPQSALKKQERKNQFLEEQLQKINNLLKLKDKQIKKHEAKLDKNPFIIFLREMPEDILQEPEQDEADIVQELPGQNGYRQDGLSDGRSTYSSVMAQMKNKKWGLKQRITFQTHREQGDKSADKRASQISHNPSYKPSKAQQNSRLPQPINQEENYDPHSKIEVNSRLRNLLLD